MNFFFFVLITISDLNTHINSMHYLYYFVLFFSILPWGLSIVYLFFSWDRISELTEILLPSFRFFQIAYNSKHMEENALIIIKLNILYVFNFFSITLSLFRCHFSTLFDYKMFKVDDLETKNVGYLKTSYIIQI